MRSVAIQLQKSSRLPCGGWIETTFQARAGALPRPHRWSPNAPPRPHTALASRAEYPPGTRLDRIRGQHKRMRLWVRALNAAPTAAVPYRPARRIPCPPCPKTTTRGGRWEVCATNGWSARSAAVRATGRYWWARRNGTCRTIRTTMQD